MGDRAAAEVLAFFEDGDGAAAARKINRSGETGDPSTDDDDVVRQCLAIVSRCPLRAKRGVNRGVTMDVQRGRLGSFLATLGISSRASLDCTLRFFGRLRESSA